MSESNLDGDGAAVDEFSMLESQITDEIEQKEQEQLQQQEAEQVAAATEALLMPLIEAGHALIAPNWDITSDEYEAFSSAGGRVLDKYFPDGLGVDKYKEEIALIVVVGGIYFKNKGKPLKAEKIEEEKNAEA